MILEDFKELSFFTELGDFVEYQGEMYYIGDDVDSLEEKGFIVEESEMESTSSLCARRNVGCSPLPSTPYVTGFNVEDLPQIETMASRVIDKENGYLPDSDKIVLRKIKDVNEYGESKDEWYEPEDHVVYDKKTNHYFCIKNGCTTCDVEPLLVDNKYQVVSADISAQEPLASTIVCREPKWMEVFELKNFRYDPTLLVYIDMIAEVYLRVPKRDLDYVLFIHNTYFYDRSDIYKLNGLVAQSKVDLSTIPKLEEHISVILDKYYTYLEEKRNV